MRFLYIAYSIAGWIALGLLLAYWAGVAHGRRLARRESVNVNPLIHDPHEDQP